jgi:hypothetical protein
MTQRARASSFLVPRPVLARSGRREGSDYEWTARSARRGRRDGRACARGATVRLCPGHGARQTPAGLRAPMSEIPERTRKPQKSGHPRPRPLYRNRRRTRATVRLCPGHGAWQTPAGLRAPMSEIPNEPESRRNPSIRDPAGFFPVDTRLARRAPWAKNRTNPKGAGMQANPSQSRRPRGLLSLDLQPSACAPR